jgi:low temperature requirement protein LtrA
VSGGWEGHARAALVLMVTWWMYAGYAWLANNVGPNTVSTRLPMLVAMACFLVMAIVVVGERWAWVCWVAACVVLAASVVRTGESGFSVRTEHFVDRPWLSPCRPGARSI